MTFNQIPGLKGSKTYLHNLLEKDRLPHAMIFTGPEGNAKLALAIAFANYLQCTNRTDEICGNCAACKKTIKYIHPDIHFVFPVVRLDGKKRDATVSTDFYPKWRSFMQTSPYGSLKDWLKFISASDKPSNINTKECNEISHKLGLKSFEAKYKILIIWNAESLGKDGNRLLKLIEEPPEDTLIFLLTDRVDKMIKTIVSRCQIINIPPFSDEEILHGLGHEDFESVKELVYLADGNMQLALSLNEGQWQNYSDELLNWMRIAYQMKPENVVQWLNEFTKKAKQEQINFLSYGLYYLKEYRKALVSTSVDVAKLSDEEKEVAIKMSKIIDEEMTRGIVQMIQKNLNHLKRNANAKILFMDMTVQLESLMKRFTSSEASFSRTG